jgi:hypothetical protein
MAAPPPESSEPDDASTDEDRFGWYVVCNGRIVVAGDKTELTGWGSDGWPRWHPQYSGFIGFVIFTSEHPALLPLTTTKRSVDQSSAVFRRAKPRLREASRQWIDYTNARKTSIDAAKRSESSTRPITIFSVPRNEVVALPAYTPRPRVRIANINYSMPLTRVRKLAKGFGDINMSYRDVGIQSFNHAFADMAEED